MRTVRSLWKTVVRRGIAGETILDPKAMQSVEMAELAVMVLRKRSSADC